MNRGVRRACVAAGALLAFAALVWLLVQHFDPARVAYKRLKAGDRYLYEEVDPKILATDPASLIAPASVLDPKAQRQRLIDLVWGSDGFPSTLRPQMVEPAAGNGDLGLPDEDIRVDRLTLTMDHGLSSVFDLMYAPQPRHRLVIYHHGFGAPISQSAPLFRALLAAGFDVMAFDLLGRARNAGLARLASDDRFYNVMSEPSAFDRPLRFHIEPVIAGLNEALATRGYRSVDMAGLSMGGFMTVLAAAVDPRIARSYPIAGDLPLYMRRGQEVLPDLVPYYPPLNAAFSRLDLYLLGASGRGRGQLQIFNRYDRCCYNGPRGTVYAAAVAQAVAATPDGGRFAVLLDETHADHRISKFTIAAILSDLEVER